MDIVKMLLEMPQPRLEKHAKTWFCTSDHTTSGCINGSFSNDPILAIEDEYQKYIQRTQKKDSIGE